MNGIPLDFAKLVPYAVFGMIAAGAWALLNWLSAAKPRAAERLDEIRNPNLRKRRRMEDETSGKRADAVTRVLAKASPAFAKPLQPKTELEANKLKLRLATAGFRGETAPTIFLGMKLLGLIGGLMTSGVTLVALQQFNQQAVLKALAFGGVMFYVPEIVLYFITKRRKEQLFLGLPDALDLMVVCVEAGLGLDQAMRKVAEEMRTTYPVISDEFSLSNFQMQVGARVPRCCMSWASGRASRTCVRWRRSSFRPINSARASLRPFACKATRCERAASNWPKSVRPKPR